MMRRGLFKVELLCWKCQLALSMVETNFHSFQRLGTGLIQRVAARSIGMSLPRYSITSLGAHPYGNYGNQDISLPC